MARIALPLLCLLKLTWRWSFIQRNWDDTVVFPRWKRSGNSKSNNFKFCLIVKHFTCTSYSVLSRRVLILTNLKIIPHGGYNLSGVSGPGNWLNIVAPPLGTNRPWPLYPHPVPRSLWCHGSQHRWSPDWFVVTGDGWARIKTSCQKRTSGLTKTA